MTARPLTSLVDKVEETPKTDHVSLGELLEAVNSRGFGPMLLLPAAIVLSPLGAIPGMAAITATIIILISAQMPFRSQPWLPRRLREITISRKRIESGTENSRPAARWIDKMVCRRWCLLAEGPAKYVIAAVSILLALTFYPLELVPWGVTVPSSAVVLLAVGLTARDGLIVAIGYAMAAAAIGVVVYFWPF
ncbi:MAG: exopolysaccharide biosynthesis protein [Planctomycetaceae bacterium]|nr:exopolysaccharide biosynthesis protein [Planctomycetaceae bacterium]